MLIVVISFLFSVNSNALELTDFNSIKTEIKIPQPSVLLTKNQSKTIETITKNHLIANTSKKIIIGYVKNDSEYKEFIDMYTKLLKDNNFKIVETKKESEMVMITYLAHDGKGIRSFIGDDLNYNAKDDNEIIKLMNEIISKAESNGINVIAKYLVKTDILRPTFMLYYLTDVNDFQEKEIRLRILKKGEDIDYELIENSVNIIKKDTSYSMVYIGKELGFVSKLAIDEKDAMVKLDNYRNFLKENNKSFINYRIKPLGQPFILPSTTYNYLLNIYFFQ